MEELKRKSFCKCSHEKVYRSKVNSKLSICLNCSSAIFIDENNQELSAIKPSEFEIRKEMSVPFFLSLPDNQSPKIFRNKKGFRKLRKTIIKKMKLFCSNFNLSKKTFFLSLDYFDKICSKLVVFNIDDLFYISQFCVILATKFQESQAKYIQVKTNLGPIKNYAKDESYLLQLLDYDLLIHTSYDLLMEIMSIGFLFTNEIFSYKKMNLIYGKIENMIYFFSETKNYMEMTNKEAVLGIIGLIRETLGLSAYNNILKSIYMNENDIQKYYACLNKIRKLFKINDDNNHSDSNTDDNSDNSLDKNSKNGNENNCNRNNNFANYSITSDNLNF